MSIQRESVRIVNPFTILLKARGWHVENIHGNQFQSGLPDQYICKQGQHPRWIEYKVFDAWFKTSITLAQRTKFPLLDANGTLIFIIAAQDLRGPAKQGERERLYKKLFQEPNWMYVLNKNQQYMLK